MQACAIILMGGSGERFGGDVPKQFRLLGDKQIYCHALDTMKNSGFFDDILLVAHSNWLKKGFIPGGQTRQESSYLGLKAFQNKPDIVLIHDAVRPFVTERVLKENIETAIRFGAANTCIPSADTIVRAANGSSIDAIPDRREYMRGQTPQTFRYDWILEAHEKALADGIRNASDDCQLVLRMGKPVHIVQGDEINFKITTEFDLRIAEQIYARV